MARARDFNELRNQLPAELRRPEPGRVSLSAGDRRGRQLAEIVLDFQPEEYAPDNFQDTGATLPISARRVTEQRW